MSRQAYYKHKKEEKTELIQADMLIQEVKAYRLEHPRMGVRKVYNKLQPFMQEHSIQIGRDKLYDLLSAHNLLIRKRKRRVRTTQSYHLFRKYPNQIKGFIATRPNQLWVSDITYWPIGEKYGYISLITDAYSHKIVGYQVGDSLATEESMKALRMALLSLEVEGHAGLIHHSDRGIQYCSKEYVCLLESHGIVISMSSQGDPLENRSSAKGLLK
jgi:putative transposase